MEKMKLHKLTHWLYTHFFHFFDIPHFLPYELIKKLLKKWNRYFNSRDDLESAIENKDDDLNNINIDGIITIIDNMRGEMTTTTNAIIDIVNNASDKMDDLDQSGSDFKSMLNYILTWQDDYEWKVS